MSNPPMTWTDEEKIELRLEMLDAISLLSDAAYFLGVGDDFIAEDSLEEAAQVIGGILERFKRKERSDS